MECSEEGVTANEDVKVVWDMCEERQTGGAQSPGQCYYCV